MRKLYDFFKCLLSTRVTVSRAKGFPILFRTFYLLYCMIHEGHFELVEVDIEKTCYVDGIYEDNVGDGIEDAKYICYFKYCCFSSAQVDFFYFCPGRAKSESGLALLLWPAHTNGL